MISKRELLVCLVNCNIMHFRKGQICLITFVGFSAKWTLAYSEGGGQSLVEQATVKGGHSVGKGKKCNFLLFLDHHPKSFAFSCLSWF